jgi:carbamoyltransferase
MKSNSCDPRSSGTGGLILGINSAYHESAAALVCDGRVVFAIEEERLTRRKHAKTACVTNPDELPWNAIRACLEAVPGASLRDLDAIAFSLAPARRLQLIGSDPYPLDHDTGFGTRSGEEEFNRRVLGIPRILAEAAGDASVADRFRFVPHHRAHAACAFYTSPFEHAAILVVDGIGETSTAWLGRGSADGIEAICEIAYPHSIGMLWERIAVYLGFTEFDACKVMGLAALGNPARFRREYDRLFWIVDPDGHASGQDGPPYRIDPNVARFRRNDVRGLESVFGPGRDPDRDVLEIDRFADIAAGLQQRTDEAILALSRRLATLTGEHDLAYSGGVALNCLSNARLEREGPFRSLFIFGAAHDAGTAIGAALDIAYQQNGSCSQRTHFPNHPLSPFLAVAYDDPAIEAAIARWPVVAEKIEHPPTTAARLIASGRIVGWFQGRMEFGPRALGARSLLADPSRPEMRDRINQGIKHREPFRPFGAAVLAGDARIWFDIPSDRPGASSCRQFMIVAYPVRPERARLIPAVVHADGTCRIQVVDAGQDAKFHELLVRFREQTGVPLVLNTSFNDREPLVATPDDALGTFASAPIDALFLGDYLVRRNP